MKWLARIGIALGALIVINISVNVVITYILTNKVTTAYESGIQEGRAQGYVVGYQEGITVGYQKGSKTGYQAGSMVNNEKGREEGYSSGYKAGFEEAIGTGYLVRNPTYDEVQEFLADEETTSAWEINNNAEARGTRAAHVTYETVYIAAKGKSYELVAFVTIDKGLIFVEPSSHKEVKLKIGKRYSELNGYSLPDYDDTITKIRVIW